MWDRELSIGRYGVDGIKVADGGWGGSGQVVFRSPAWILGLSAGGGEECEREFECCWVIFEVKGWEVGVRRATQVSGFRIFQMSISSF